MKMKRPIAMKRSIETNLISDSIFYSTTGTRLNASTMTYTVLSVSIFYESGYASYFVILPQMSPNTTKYIIITPKRDMN